MTIRDRLMKWFSSKQATTAFRCECGSLCVVKKWQRRDLRTGLMEDCEGYACDSPGCRWNPTKRGVE